jgi:hypothetical protein
MQMSGRTVADGHGVDRTLDLSHLASIAAPRENPIDGGSGWVALNGGKLKLPSIAVLAGTEAYTWGESSDDPTLDMVNSLRVTFDEAPAEAGSLSIALLSRDRDDVPELPDGHNFIGIWSMLLDGEALTDAALSIRYDEQRGKELGLNEANYKLWAYDGEQWHRIHAGLALDNSANLIGGHIVGDFTHVGVSAPEPAGLLLATLGGLLLARRRARPREADRTR